MKPSIHQRRIAIIGTINAEIITGPIRRLPPWGRQTRSPRTEICYAGSAARVAFPLRALGHGGGAVFGVIGDDVFGAGCRRELKAHGVAVDGVEQIRGERTASCIAMVRRDGERLYLSDLGVLGKCDDRFLERWAARLSTCQYVLLTGLFTLPGLTARGVRRCFAHLRARGVTTLLDPGWHMERSSAFPRRELAGLLKETDYFLPNAHETAQWTGKRGNVRTQLAALRAMGANGIFLKLGARGAACLVKDEFIRAKRVPIRPRNTTAAGECFNAGVLHGLTQGWKATAILQLANRMAARYVATGHYDL